MKSGPSTGLELDRRYLALALEHALQRLADRDSNKMAASPCQTPKYLHFPSETTSTVPSTTAMAVWSSMA